MYYARKLCKQWGMGILAVVLALGIAAYKYHPGEINYHNGDATWHTLLTLEAYGATPVKTHLFLPIISLGQEDDKEITWGATIPDQEGNYYYTSFSPAGYVAPWLFMRVFHLPVSQDSLYLFNSLLFAASAAIWCSFISWFYRKHSWGWLMGLLALEIYLLSPELLHSMGVSYWHQSLMQVTLPLQLAAYLYSKETGSRFALGAFCLLTLANPYIEWTGYVANMGYAAAELFTAWKDSPRKALGRAAGIGALTAASLGLFVGHYLLRVDSQKFFSVMKGRFLARSADAAVTMADLTGGYVDSFLFFWLLIIALIIWNLIRTRKLELHHLLTMFLLAVPVLENVLMKNHAVYYTYDRMKGVFLLSFVACQLVESLFRQGASPVKTGVAACLGAAVLGLANLQSYVNNEKYIWETDYRQDNQVLAEYINQNYRDSVLGLENSEIRGYMNLLFGRGIYERKGRDTLEEIAWQEGKRYVVMLQIEEMGVNCVYDLGGAEIYDLQNNSSIEVTVDQGNITLSSPKSSQ